MSWRPDPPDRSVADPRPVAASLGRLAADLGVAPPPVLSAVFAHWEELAGAEVAAHARPLSLRDGVLVVGVEQPAWATELRFLTPQLLRRAAEVAGEGAVTEVVVRVPGDGSASARPRRGGWSGRRR